MLIIRISWNSAIENEAILENGIEIMKKLCSIRGAITVKKNSRSEIEKATTDLLKTIFKKNKLNKSNVVNIFFTFTNDLNEVNPATVARKTLSLDSVPMLCSQEIKIKGAMPRCIRVMVQAYVTNEHISHIYLNKAKSLRPDLNLKK